MTSPLGFNARVPYSYLWAGIGGVRNWDLSGHHSPCETRQTLQTELCRPGSVQMFFFGEGGGIDKKTKHDKEMFLRWLGRICKNSPQIWWFDSRRAAAGFGSILYFIAPCCRWTTQEECVFPQQPMTPYLMWYLIVWGVPRTRIW